MKLNLMQIQAITSGAVRVEQDQTGIRFFRFTEEQDRLYRERNSGFHMKSQATSGVRLRFETDSASLAICMTPTPGSSRTYYAMDLFVNGIRQESIQNFESDEMIPDYTRISLSLERVYKQFQLGAGKKEVDLYLPWSVGITLHELSLDEGAWIQPLKAGKKMLCFGDSITQGYDALHPSAKYTSRLANALNAEEYNKAIGGEIFFPELADAREDFEPDYITVAYGTNDWSGHSRERFLRCCTAFYRNLNRNYPNAKIFAITPIWRKDLNTVKEFGPFETVEEIIRQVVAPFENITVIRGFEFVPENEALYADLRLHPNDAGFDCYFKRLLAEIRGKI